MGKGFPTTEFKYDAYGNVEYAGIAPKGQATSKQCWIVFKLTYQDIAITLPSNDGLTSRQVIRMQSSPDNSIFDNYLTLTYD